MMEVVQRSDWSIKHRSHAKISVDKDQVSNKVSTIKKIDVFKWPLVSGLVLGLVSGGIILAVVIKVWLTSSSKTTTSIPSTTNVIPSLCSSTTCIGQETPYHTSVVTLLYPFDGNFNDLTGQATGIGYGSPAPGFSPGAYVGSASLFLNALLLQYVQIPYVNLAQHSFTLQAWLFSFGFTIPSEYGIFSQCDSNSICFLLSLRNAHFTLSFDAMNTNNYTLIGSSVIPQNSWVHVTVIYDAVLSQQRIYVNGRIDAISSGTVNPYQGTSTGSITTIGKSLSFATGSSYFNGRIDHFTISAGVARTACQIYNDATLVAYYPFDTAATNNDYSVNAYNGISWGTTLVSAGHVGQAIMFSSNPSYFQAPCFPPQIANNPSFSFSLWINPTTLTNGGTLVHISSLQNGTGSICYDLLAFTSTGALVVQWVQSNSLMFSAQGPIIPINTWTHVAVVYGQVNGVRLFIAGQLSISSQYSSSLSLQTSSTRMYVTLGNNSPLGSSNCLSGTVPIVSGSYTGAIDEFRLYNRELDSQEMCVLANM